jgi:hypothetical protein
MTSKKIYFLFNFIVYLGIHLYHQEIYSSVTPSIKLVGIYGKGGIGKTSTMLWLRDYLSSNPSLYPNKKFIFMFADTRPLGKKLDDLFTSFGSPKGILGDRERYWENLAKNFLSNPVDIDDARIEVLRSLIEDSISQSTLENAMGGNLNGNWISPYLKWDPSSRIGIMTYIGQEMLSWQQIGSSRISKIIDPSSMPCEHGRSNTMSALAYLLKKAHLSLGSEELIIFVDHIANDGDTNFGIPQNENAALLTVSANYLDHYLDAERLNAGPLKHLPFLVLYNHLKDDSVGDNTDSLNSLNIQEGLGKNSGIINIPLGKDETKGIPPISGNDLKILFDFLTRIDSHSLVQARKIGVRPIFRTR